MNRLRTHVYVLIFLLLSQTVLVVNSLRAQTTITLSQSPVVLENASRTLSACGIQPTAKATYDFLFDIVSGDDTGIRGLIANLDSDEYAVREAAEKGLVKKGLKASGLLKAAMKAASPETRMRASRCLKCISSDSLSILQAAINVVSMAPSKGYSSAAKIELLIRLGKRFPEPRLQTAIASGIAQNADSGSKNLIVAGLQSDQTIIRRACVFGLPKCLSAAELSKFELLLTDSNEDVAFAAIYSFGKHFPQTTVTHLTENLLTSDQAKTRMLAHRMLSRISSKDFGYLAHQSQDKRRDATGKWQAWAKELTADQQLDFSKLALPIHPRPRGFVVSVNSSGATILDLEGNVVRKIESELYDAQVCNGHRLLVCERNLGTVRLLDQKSGKPLRSVEGLSTPSDAELLSDGNILILQGVGVATEHDRSGRILRKFEGLDNPFDVDRLENGNTIVADSGNNRLVEFNPNGKVVWEKKGLAFPNNVFRMPDNRTLYTTYTSGDVVMLDGQGQEQWRTSIENGTLYSVYCGGGEIYVADGGNQKVVVLDMDGKPIREIKIGLAFCDVGFITE